jgi:SAM-dependent methyltransferase
MLRRMHAEPLIETNEVERRRWNDERRAAVWPKRERLTDAVTGLLLEAAAPQTGERVLDVGCGGGRTSLAASLAVGADGVVVGADISAPLRALAVERAREAGVANVDFELVDMQTDTVPGGPFDVAISQFGVMFFDEPVTAFRNIRAQLGSGGRLAFACWQASELNPWFFGLAVTEFVPPPPELAPGKSPTGPFSLADHERTTAILTSAGFQNVRCTAHELVVEAPHDAVVDDVQLELLGIPEEKLPAARAATAEYMRRFVVGPEVSRFPLAFQIFEAGN